LIAFLVLLITIASFLSDWGRWRHEVAVRLRQGMPRDGSAALKLISDADNNSTKLPFTIVVVGKDSANRVQGGTPTSLLSAAQSGECRIPTLQVDRPEVMRFYTHRTQPYTLDCRQESGNKSENWLRLDDSRRLQATDYGLRTIGVEKMKCQLRHFERVTDSKVEWMEWEEVKVGVTHVTKGDFLRVRCQYGSGDGEGKTDGGAEWSALFMTAVRNETRAKQLENVRKRDNLEERTDW